MPSVSLPAMRQRALHHHGDAVLVDVLHREDMHLRVADLLLLERVQVADADEHRPVRAHFRRARADLRELGRLRPEQRRERHAVHVAAGGRRRRVHVAVRVHPEQADLAAVRGREIRRRADRPGAPASDRRRGRPAAHLLRGTGTPAGRASGTRARSRGCTSSSDRARTCVSGIGAARSPRSATTQPERARRSPIPAIRTADGPMSTPRRPPPRSSGTPRMCTVRAFFSSDVIERRPVRGWGGGASPPER